MFLKYIFIKKGKKTCIQSQSDIGCLCLPYFKTTQFEFQVSWKGWKWKLLTAMCQTKCRWEIKICCNLNSTMTHILHLNHFECINVFLHAVKDW